MLKRNISDLREVILLIEDATYGVDENEVVKLIDVRHALELYIQEVGTELWCKRKPKSEYQYEVEYDFEDKDATIVDELESYVVGSFRWILQGEYCAVEDLSELYWWFFDSCNFLATKGATGCPIGGLILDEKMQLELLPLVKKYLYDIEMETRIKCVIQLNIAEAYRCFENFDRDVYENEYMTKNEITFLMFSTKYNFDQKVHTFNNFPANVLSEIEGTIFYQELVVAQ